MHMTMAKATGNDTMKLSLAYDYTMSRTIRVFTSNENGNDIFKRHPQWQIKCQHQWKWYL